MLRTLYPQPRDSWDSPFQDYGLVMCMSMPFLGPVPSVPSLKLDGRAHADKHLQFLGVAALGVAKALASPGALAAIGTCCPPV